MLNLIKYEPPFFPGQAMVGLKYWGEIAGS